MPTLPAEKVERIVRALDAQHAARRLISGPISCKMFPQLDLPVEMVWRLGMLTQDCYVLFPIEALEPSRISGTLTPGISCQKSPKIPFGTVTYVVLYEDPLSVFCFEHAELGERPDLRGRTNGIINYGHSSLGFNVNKPRMFDQSLSREERLRRGAKPVLLAGNLNFVMEEDPRCGAGTLISWSVESGHYRPSDRDAVNNRVGFVRDLLPMDKFNRIDWEAKVALRKR